MDIVHKMKCTLYLQVPAVLRAVAGWACGRRPTDAMPSMRSSGSIANSDSLNWSCRLDAFDPRDVLLELFELLATFDRLDPLGAFDPFDLVDTVGTFRTNDTLAPLGLIVRFNLPALFWLIDLTFGRLDLLDPSKSSNALNFFCRVSLSLSLSSEFSSKSRSCISCRHVYSLLSS